MKCNRCVETVNNAHTCTAVRTACSITERPSNFQYKVRQHSDHKNSVQLQDWSGSDGSTKLRFPDLMTKAQDSVKVISLKHRPP